MTRGRLRTSRTLLLALALALAPTTCGEDPAPTRASTPSPPSPSPSVRPYVEEWIAVIDVASDPEDLDELTQQMLGPLGTALVVSPVDCFEGLPDSARDGYLIGAVGDSRSEVEALVIEAEEEVAFSALVRNLCTD